jgi:hypothetical protein
MPQDAAQSVLEQTFSDLANARLRDSSPALLDYLIGFQLIKADPDGSRAVGMFGFKIGEDDWHYAASFFLNGEIKGLDSLYSVKSDLFVPLNEKWVNAVVNRRPITLGEPDTRSRRSRGVKTPDYNRLRTLPSGITDGSAGMGKISSEKMPQIPIHKIAEMRVIADAVSVPAGLAAMGKLAVEGFLADWNRYPKLAEAVETFYSKMDFEIPGARKFGAEKDADPVTIISTMDQEGADSLTDAQKEQVLRGDVAVVDKRPEMQKSRTYSTQVKQQLTNPNRGGLYDIVWDDGSVHQCLVLPVYMADGDIFVYDLKSDKSCITKTKNLWSMREYTAKDFSEKLEGVSKPSDEINQWDVAVLVCADGGMAAEPFMVRQRNDGADDVITLKKGYSPCIRSYTQADFRAKGRPIIGYPSNSSYGGFYPSGGDYEDIVVTAAGNKHMTRVKSRLFVNSQHYRAIIIDRQPPKKDNLGGYSLTSTQNDRLNVTDFGDHNTILKVLEKVASPLKAWRTDSELVFQDDVGTHSFSGVAPALGHLIRKHGCAVDDARTVIELAMRQPTNWLIKRADDDFMDMPQINDSTEGGVMSSYHQTQVPWENIGKKPSQNNRQFYEYNSPFAAGSTDNDSDNQEEADPFKVVDKAAKTGQKEVFDAALLGSLVNSNTPTEYVERFLPTIVAGMDRLGRLLFLLYWHYDEFQERYGKDDLSEFTDNLKSTFEAVGDLVIFMRKRTLSGDPEFYGLGLSASMDG